MLFMITGLPGAGKTQYTLHRMTSDPQLLNREVHYHGIPELQLPWVKLQDPRAWFDAPDGSVIVIDEAQKVFPLRSAGALVPKWVSEFETHRHRGIDVVLVTQDASLVDAHVRKLTERHFVLKRPFGLDYAKVYEFHGIGDINNSGSVKQSVQSRFNYDKELYAKYKSATIHAVKKRMPWKLFVLPASLLAIGGILYGVYGSMFKDDPAAPEVASVTVDSGTRPIPAGKRQVAPVADGSLPRALPDYLEHFTPRHGDIPQSAPIYDQLVSAVKDFPRIMGCMSSEKKCWCYSQQGTKLDMKPQICQAWVAQGGFFDPYKEQRNQNNLQAARVSSSPVTSTPSTNQIGL